MDLTAEVEQICHLLLPTSLVPQVELHVLVFEQSELAKAEVRRPKYAKKVLSLYESSSGGLQLPSQQLKVRMTEAFTSVFRGLVVERVEEAVQARAIKAALQLPVATPAALPPCVLCEAKQLHQSTSDSLRSKQYATQDNFIGPTALAAIHSELVKMEGAGTSATKLVVND
jgi:hypothetical protein